MIAANHVRVPTTAARRPQPKGGSRKGVPNKNTGAIKEMIKEALEQCGGVDYLVSRANDPRTAGAFLGLLAKILPTQVTGEDGGPLKFTVIERRVVRPEN